MANKKRKRKQPSIPVIGKIVKWTWIVLLSGLIFSAVYVFSVRINLFNLFGDLPSYKSLENPEAENDLSSILYSMDGKVLGKYFRLNRTQATFDDLSPALVNTLLTTEDIRFYDHSGIDLRGMVRVVVKNILLGKESSGRRQYHLTTISEKPVQDEGRRTTGKYLPP